MLKMVSGETNHEGYHYIKYNGSTIECGSMHTSMHTFKTSHLDHIFVSHGIDNEGNKKGNYFFKRVLLQNGGLDSWEGLVSKFRRGGIPVIYEEEVPPEVEAAYASQFSHVTIPSIAIGLGYHQNLDPEQEQQIAKFAEALGDNHIIPLSFEGDD